MNPKAKIIFYDLEMLCDRGNISEEYMETIRIGASSFCPETNTFSFFDSFVKPMHSSTLSTFCKELTGIKQSNIDSALPFDKVFDSFLKWTGNLENVSFYSWGYNDLKRIEIDFKHHGMDAERFQSFAERHTNFQDIFSMITGTSRSVEYAINLYGSSFIGKPHNPKYDAYNTLRVYLHSSSRPFFNEYLFLRENFFFGSNFLYSYVDSIKRMDDFPSFPEKKMLSIQKKIKAEVVRKIDNEAKQFLARFRSKSDKRLIKELKKVKQQCKKLRTLYLRLENNPSCLLVPSDLLAEQRVQIDVLYDTICRYDSGYLDKNELSSAVFDGFYSIVHRDATKYSA